MKHIRTHSIDYHISEADVHHQNQSEGVIRELRRKWYCTMIGRHVPRELGNYGIRWVSETTSLTHSSAGKLKGVVPLTEVTGDISDISEYLDFGFYEKIWFKDNTGVSPFETGHWLGFLHCTGRLMCYHVLTQRGTVISRSTVQRVANI